ncbi:MAG: hypothetical protein R6V29_02365 [Spirochaetia bacterium]
MLPEKLQMRGVSRTVVLVVIAVGLTAGDLAAQAEDDREPREPAEDQFFDAERYDDDEWMVDDRNDDGSVDYAVRIDEDLMKDREAVDHNHDGKMDDFYFYSNEVLQRQELDTNHDGSIDLWVFIKDGVYVERYERDTNHDGVADEIRDYAESE